MISGRLGLHVDCWGTYIELSQLVENDGTINDKIHKDPAGSVYTGKLSFAKPISERYLDTKQEAIDQFHDDLFHHHMGNQQCHVCQN